MMRVKFRPHTAAMLAFCFAALYLATANYTRPQSVDTVATYQPAWQFVRFGNLHLDAFAGTNPWIVHVGGHWFSNRFPGAIFVNVPMYWLSGGVMASWPAAVTSALISAGIVVALYLLLKRLVEPRVAMVLAVAAGLGTSLWSVTADASWSSGPAVLCLMLALVAVSRNRFLLAGLALGAGVLARPYLALAALGIGLVESWIRRDVRCSLKIGLGSIPGVALLLAYNRLIFGHFTIAGGYASYATDFRGTAGRATAGGAGLLGGAKTFLTAIAGSLVSPQRGLILFSPIVLVLVLVLWRRRIWHQAPSWVRAAAVAGLLSLLGQLWVNGFTGGAYYYGYRLPLIALACVLPLMALAVQDAVRRPRSSSCWVALVAISVFVQAMGALPGYRPSEAMAPWSRSDFASLLGVRSPLTIGACAIFAVAVAAWSARSLWAADRHKGEMQDASLVRGDTRPSTRGGLPVTAN